MEASATIVAASLVICAAPETPSMFSDTSCVPREASCTLRAISVAAAPCCSTAVAMLEEICEEVSSVAFEV
ncbi:hypothetical protein [Breoghania sp.]|uniref:hypothetical protein n=1 Tax=Breoghania sp. TaxID=2065378 RepID=UPI0026398CDD|nr:hypothetical protein [Breoghania sp.]MDJ0930379.1 hypothetical protein [Breoghania sp.]